MNQTNKTGAVKSYKDLIVWQTSFELVAQVYKKTSELPKSEIYGLTNQMRRSAVSIPSNIAEGQQRHNTKEYTHFLGIARGSAGELETQLLLVAKIFGLNTEEEINLLHEIQKMLHAIYRKLSTSH